jgi:uncharacterized protein
VLALLLAAFATGVLGSAHCVAMCGGIVGTLSGSIDPNLRKRPSTQLGYVLAYNVGRIASYAAFGAVFAALAMGLSRTLVDVQLVLRGIAGALMLCLGLYLVGLFPRFTAIERLGAPVFAKVSPWAKRLLPVRSHTHAAALGALWGWVPCGMVYTALALATASGQPAMGALTMVAFGLGTLPAMLTSGIVSGHVLARFGSIWVRRTAGVVIAVFGVMSVVFAGVAMAAQSDHSRADVTCHPNQ